MIKLLILTEKFRYDFILKVIAVKVFLPENQSKFITIGRYGSTSISTLYRNRNFDGGHADEIVEHVISFFFVVVNLVLEVVKFCLLRQAGCLSVAGNSMPRTRLSGSSQL